MQCNFLLDNKTKCKNKTIKSNKYCTEHLDFKFPKPKTCPVCFNSIHQCTRPLSCHHWIHKSCIRKSGKRECPICRKDLPEIEHVEQKGTPENDIELPQNSAIFAVIAFKLYSKIIHPAKRVMGLDHFITGVLDVFIPLDHPLHATMATFLYAEALEYFFNPIHI